MYTEQDLILYYYEDGLNQPDREAIAEALASDPDLRRRYRTLTASLDEWSGQLDPVQPTAQAQQRWHRALQQAANTTPDTTRPFIRLALKPTAGLLWGGIAATAMLFVLTAGIYIGRHSVALPQANPAFAQGIRVHLHEVEEQLAHLDLGDARQRQQLVAEILDQNRLFQRAAEHQQAPELVRVLRAFELILQDLSASDIGQDDALATRRRLTFELGVIQTKLDASVSKPTQTL